MFRYTLALRRKERTYRIQILKSGIVKLRPIAFRPPQIRYKQRPAACALARTQAIRRILNDGALRRRHRQLPDGLQKNIRLRL